MVGINSKGLYSLVSKTVKADIKTFAKKGIVIPEDATAFSCVQIGKKGDDNYLKEIISFYDKRKNLSTRYIRESNQNDIIRNYDTFCHSRKIKTTEYIPSKYDLKDSHGLVITPSIFGQYKHKGTEIQSVSVFNLPLKDGPKRCHTVDIYKNIHNNENGVPVRHIKMGTYNSAALSGHKQTSFDILKGNDGYTYRNFKKTDNVNISPETDEFFAIKYLEPDEDVSKEITNFFLKKKGLDKLGIKIAQNSPNVSENAGAHFSNYFGAIEYKGKASIGMAAHEVEHAYQHSQIGRIGKGYSDYEKRCEKLFGKITDPKEYEEAMKYHQASVDYPRTSASENLRENPKYWNNYLEIKAREAEDAAKAKYENEYVYNDFFNLLKTLECWS